MAEKKKITKRDVDYSQWYLDVIEAAGLAENSVVRGSMVIKPNGYAIWEGIKEMLDNRFKETGHVNAYFPLFIPKSLLSREAEHVKGFAKECAVVTHHRLIDDPNGEGVVVDPEAKLDEELIVRPTSETIMYETYKDWIESWRDLPMLINQWNNVVRWELRTRPFLRTAEFLWQEGHTAHATEDDAEVEVLQMLGIYQELAEDYLALSPVAGRKSESEKFAGALRTYTLEMLMQDGKALQSATSHNLGQNFAKAFGVQYASQEGDLKYVWQTSWGLSTRIIGGLIMTHSDDRGLVLPPKIAPKQVAIVPIFKSENQEHVLTNASKLQQDLAANGVRAHLDARNYETPGAKFNDWEKQGVPLRLELGPRDIENDEVVIVPRIEGFEKETVKRKDVASRVEKLLVEIQDELKENADRLRENNTHEVDTYEQFKQILADQKGFLSAFWCEDETCEEQIKDETKATVRCLPNDQQEEKGKCLKCGGQATQRWLFAVAY